MRVTGSKTWELSGDGGLKPIKIPMPIKLKDPQLISDPRAHNEEFGNQHAVDILCPIGTPVFAVRPGKVIAIVDEHPDEHPSKASEGELNEILIVDDEGVIQHYAHLQQGTVRQRIKVDDTIKEGDQIGCSGHNGRSTVPHLHLSLARVDESNEITGLKSLPITFIKENSNLD